HRCQGPRLPSAGDHVVPAGGSLGAPAARAADAKSGTAEIRGAGIDQDGVGWDAEIVPAEVAAAVARVSGVGRPGISPARVDGGQGVAELGAEELSGLFKDGSSCR